MPISHQYVIELGRQVGELEEENSRLRLALTSIYEWYDTDGSVGGASDVFEDHRKVLNCGTQQLKPEG